MMNYCSETNYNNELKIKKLLEELPPFIRQFDVFMANQRNTTRTRLNYMYDYSLFFEFLLGLETFNDRRVKSDFQVEDLEKVNRNDIENYLLTFDVSRRNKEDSKNNAEKLKARKLFSIKSLYSYFSSIGDITVNPAAITSTPISSDKSDSVVLEPDEIKRIFHCIDTGQGLKSNKQILTASKTKLRDKAIIGTLLGTGIRISECVGLDVDDVDFEDESLRLVRKGGYYDMVYFTDNVGTLLLDYITNERESLEPETNALFVSSSHGRLTDRSIEYMVKKYVTAAGIPKHVKVHTLRATFATEIYNKTNDIYMVKDSLNLKSIAASGNYVNEAKDRKQKDAAKAVKKLFS